MKRLIVATIALLHTPSALAAPFELYCVTEIPSTSFLIKEHDGKLEARVIHHSGAKYAVMFSGMITPMDLETLKPRAKTTEKLPADATFFWPLENCKFHENMRFECFGTNDVKTIGGVKLEPFSLDSAIMDHDNIAGKYRELEISFGVRVDGADTTVSMQYQIAACHTAL